MGEPKVSVCMPCYNRQDYIAEAIDSVLAQSFSDFELIITDDCSTDIFRGNMRSNGHHQLSMQNIAP